VTWSVKSRSLRGLPEVLHRLIPSLEGKLAAGDTWGRRYRGLNTAVEYAVELGELNENPLRRSKRGGSRQQRRWPARGYHPRSGPRTSWLATVS